MHEGSSDDPLLSAYISIVLQSKNTDVDVFPSTMGVLDRPMFFERYFRCWIDEAIEEIDMFEQITKEAQEKVTQA